MRIWWQVSVVAAATLLLCSAGEGGPPSGSAVAEVVPNATQAEKDLLLAVREVQPEAVVALSEALATAQAIRRARDYLAAWQGDSASASLPKSAELEALDRQIHELQDRFLTLFHAHYGNKASYHLTRRRKLKYPTTIEIGDEAARLAGDAAARSAARAAFMRDCQAARQQACVLLETLRETLLQVQRGASGLSPMPAWAPTPAFADKLSATLRPDGTTTGILFCVDGLTRHPGLRTLGTDFAGCSYARDLRNYRLNRSYGRKSTLIVPCAVGTQMRSSARWVNEHRHLPVFRGPAPKEPVATDAMRALDFYHPAVREWLEVFLSEVGAQFKGDPYVLMYKQFWEPWLSDRTPGKSYEWGHWPTGGRFPAGVKAFQGYLADKFRAIDRLNAAWGSNYTSFDAVQPPPDVMDAPEPQRSQLTDTLYKGGATPLYYEFNRFLKQSYADYAAWCYRTLKAADPTHAICMSPSHGALDGYLCMGRDSFRWATDACDLFGSELTNPMEEVFTYSIHRATGRTTGIFECVWNAPYNESFPPEREVAAAGSVNLWRMVAWGRRVLDLFGAEDTYGGTANNNMMVLESGYNLVRPAAGIVPVVKRKLRSMEDVWLQAPVVEPQIAVLKPSASQLCEWPWGTVVSTCGKLHDLLYTHHYHYAFVPEEYVLSGREDLNRYRALLLPFATQFPPGLTDKILPWVRSGGTLIIAGVAGAYTAYGERDGRLMAELFGQIEQERVGDLAWKIHVGKLRAGVLDVGAEPGRALLADYGKGRALLAAEATDLAPEGVLARRCLELVDAVAPRRVWATGAPVEIVLRQSEGHLHITLINPDVRREARLTVYLARPCGLAVDRGIERGFAVPLRDHGSGQAFDITLAPGEGTLITTYEGESKGR